MRDRVASVRGNVRKAVGAYTCACNHLRYVLTPGNWIPYHTILCYVMGPRVSRQDKGCNPEACVRAIVTAGNGYNFLCSVLWCNSVNERDLNLLNSDRKTSIKTHGWLG